MTTESVLYNHPNIESELIITSSFDKSKNPFSTDPSIHSGSSSYGHHHPPQSSNMYFHTNFGDTFFLKRFTTSSHRETFYVCLFIFFLAILYNILKSYQYYLSQKNATIETTCYPVAEKFSESGSSENGNHHQIKSWIKCLLSAHNFLDSLIHMIQVTIGYLLMLAIMTFNIWILTSVILGEGIGYFIFGWIRRSPGSDANQMGDDPCFFRQTCSGNLNEKESK